MFELPSREGDRLKVNRPTFKRALRRDPLGAEGGGFEPPVREPVRQFSKLLVSATHPSFQKDPGVRNRGVISLIAGAKVRLFFEPCKFSSNFFKFSLNFLHFCRSDKRDSNPRPSAWEANALPTELLSLAKKRARTVLVLTLKNWREPIAGLEPATHALRMRCSTN